MTKAKIKLSKEQAEAIERHLGYSGNDIADLLNLHAEESNWVREFESLNDLSQADMARALLIGYEVEPELEVGDWVKSKVTGDIGRVTEIKRNGDVVTDVQLVGYRKDFFLTNKSFMFEKQTIEEIRQEKERRKWAEIGREVGEIRQGDIGVSNSGFKTICKREIEKAYAHNSLIGFYPTESYVCLLDGDADV